MHRQWFFNWFFKWRPLPCIGIDFSVPNRLSVKVMSEMNMKSKTNVKTTCHMKYVRGVFFLVLLWYYYMLLNNSFYISINILQGYCCWSGLSEIILNDMGSINSDENTTNTMKCETIISWDTPYQTYLGTLIEKHEANSTLSTECNFAN